MEAAFVAEMSATRGELATKITSIEGVVEAMGLASSASDRAVEAQVASYGAQLGS